MVKRYSIAWIEGTTPPGWHDYVLASDYEALAAELAECKTVIQYDYLRSMKDRIRALEAALRRLETACIESGDLYYASIATAALTAADSPKGG
jgi:hypothetical protein